MSDVRIETVSGRDALAHLDDLARLRIAVFRAWPYIYEGDVGYEREYLAAFAAAPDALIVLARTSDGAVVGASTAMPLAAAEPAIRAPFEDVGMDVGAILYFGESVLDAAYRGRGLGHAFFDAREAHARTTGAQAAAFCGVMRPDDHPRRDPAYRPLDGFWRARGYAPVPGLICHLSWKDLGDERETEKPLQFWMRRL